MPSLAGGQLIHLRRTQHQTLSVYQQGDIRQLRVDDAAIQSAIDLNAPTHLLLPYTQAMMAMLLFQPVPARVLMLGLGGGDMVRFLHHHLTDIAIRAVEIDREVITLARDYFELPERRCEYIEEDASRFIQNDHGIYDTLLVDIYDSNGPPIMFRHWEFFLHCQRLLSPQGVLALNLITEDEKLFRDIIHKVRETFGYLSLCLKIPGHKNVIIFAFNKKPARVDRAGLFDYATELSGRYDLDFTALVENLFTTNPLNAGELIL